MVFYYKDKISYIKDLTEFLIEFEADLFKWNKSITDMKDIYFVNITNFYLFHLINENEGMRNNKKFISKETDINVYTKIQELISYQLKYLHFWEHTNQNPFDYIKFDTLHLNNFI